MVFPASVAVFALAAIRRGAVELKLTTLAGNKKLVNDGLPPFKLEDTSV